MLENDMSFSLALTIDKICEIILLDLQSHCKNEELKKQIEKHQRSLNSSLDLNNIEDMDVEGLD